MKKLIWKLRYTIAIKNLLHLPWRHAWNNAGSSLEMTHGDTSECPLYAAQEEYEEWRNQSDMTLL